MDVLRTEGKKERITKYWTNRSEDFAKLRMKELESNMAQRWMEEISKYLPERKGLKILDVGTGCGFFALLLSLEGHEVTGIDLTASMITKAQKMSKERNIKAEFLQMDAENLIFESESFDVVVARNLTWTLPNPKKAYREWMRVLKKDGILLNFDADYGTSSFAEEAKTLPPAHAHNVVSSDLMEECDAIKQGLSISYEKRPEWDVKVLKELGYEKIVVDLSISNRIYQEESQFYNPTPMFLVKTSKKMFEQKNHPY